jgi:hypothetical protein
LVDSKVNRSPLAKFTPAALILEQSISLNLSLNRSYLIGDSWLPVTRLFFVTISSLWRPLVEF